jgi:hypothetical protein
MSLVAAIPAAFLAYLSIMAWVRYTENMGTGMMVVNGGTTAVSVLVALIPIIILVGRRRPKEDAKSAAAAGAGAAAVEGDEAPAAGTGELVDVADSEHVPLPDEADLSDSSEIEQSETDAFDFEADEFEDAGSDEPVEFEDEK